jgi:hypothetical protein
VATWNFLFILMFREEKRTRNMPQTPQLTIVVPRSKTVKMKRSYC